MNYYRIAGTLEGIYTDRKLLMEHRSELCKTLAAMDMTVRPETKMSDEAATDIIDA